MIISMAVILTIFEISCVRTYPKLSTLRWVRSLLPLLIWLSRDMEDLGRIATNLGKQINELHFQSVTRAFAPVRNTLAVVAKDDASRVSITLQARLCQGDWIPGI